MARKARTPKDLTIAPGEGPSLNLTRAPIYSDQPWLDADEKVSNRRAPKETIIALARKHTNEAVLTLVYHMRNSRDPEISMEAAKALLSRGWGEAPKVVGVISDPNDGTGKPLISLEDKIAILESAAVGEGLPLSIPPDALDNAKPVEQIPASPQSDLLD